MVAHMRIIPRWQGIRNGSDRPQRLKDRLLPNGAITLQPGEKTSIPRDVWRRHMFPCQLWMQNTDVMPEPPIAEDIEATEDPAESESEVTENTATPPRRRGRPRKKKDEQD